MTPSVHLRRISSENVECEKNDKIVEKLTIVVHETKLVDY